MSSRRFSVLVALLLALSLGLKAAAASGDPRPAPAATIAAARAMLIGSGFATRIHRLARSPGLLLEAQSKGCRLLAGDYPVHDTFANVYQDLRKGRDRL